MPRSIRVGAIIALAIALALVLHAPSSAWSFLHGAGPAPYGPPPGLGESSQRVLPAVAAAGRGYRFLNTRPDGTPVTFSPCRAWYVVINPRNAPRGQTGLVRSAVAQVQRATGLRLIVEGRTAEKPTVDRASYQPQRYGDRWAPILVGWASTGRGKPAGRGGPQMALRTTGDPQYVTGSVVVDRAGSFNSDPALLRALLAHELAHVVGLAHSADRRSLMYPVNHGQRRFNRADRAGLSLLGRGRCATAG